MMKNASVDTEFWRWQEYHRIMPNKKWTSKDLNHGRG